MKKSRCICNYSKICVVGILSILFIMLLCPSVVFANENVDLSALKDGEAISICGQENKLYREYISPENAIKDIKVKAKNVLTLLSNEYSLDVLSSNNIDTYRDCMYDLLDSSNCPSNYNESNEEFVLLRNFFDIYENTSKNSKVRALANQNGSSNLEELALLLPFDDPLVKSYTTNFNGSTYNYTAAINYANRYAVTPNRLYYYVFSKDCTNFVSQCLESAGVKQAVYSSEYSGWWHIRHAIAGGTFYTHTHSRSWTIADIFCRYQGVVFTNTVNTSFRYNINKGSLIAADYVSDGDWDHCGIVTEKSTSDYKVAQHTSNYNAWTSSSVNNWENIGRSGGRYARLRI